MKTSLSATLASEPLEVRGLRTRRLTLALGTSIVAKALAAVVQLVAIPLVIRGLGVQSYVAYAAMLAVSAWPSLITLRHGPAFVGRVAHLVADAKLAHVRRLVWSGAIAVTATATVGAAITAILLLMLPLTDVLPLGAGVDGFGLLCALAVLICLNLMQAPLAPLEEAQAGMQENYILNLRDLAANLLTLPLMVFGFRQWPSFVFLVAAMNLPRATMRFVNAGLLMKRHPALRPTTQAFALKDYLPLALDGAAFTLAAGASAYLCHQAPILFGARMLDADATASLAATLQLLLQAFAVVTFLTVPVIPAVRDALARRDIAWARRAISRVLWCIVGFSVCLGFGLIAVGKLLFEAWLGGRITPELDVRVAAAVYFGLLAIEFVLLVLTSALAPARQRAIAYGLYCCRGVLTAAFAWLSFRNGWVPGMFWGGVVWAALFVCLPLSLAMIRRLRIVSTLPTA